MTTFNDEVLHLGGVPVSPLLLGMNAGNAYFLDPANGSDSNDGRSPDNAFASLETAYAALTANQNDILYYIAGATSLSLTAAFEWAKSYTHFIGLCAPVGAAKRARIFMTSTVTSTPMFKVSASGCVFKDLYIFHGIADAAALVCAEVTGGRNYFENVHFAGIGNATQDATGAASLKLNGAEECMFKSCQIGLDTIARGADTSEILVDGSAKRIVFDDCLIYAYIDNAGHAMVQLADNQGLDRFMIFKNCLFLSESLNNGTAMTSAFELPASLVTSAYALINCTAVGISAWDSNSRTKTYANMPDPAASAGGGIATTV